MKSHKDLDVWKLGMDLTVEVYQLTEKLPKHELYGLTSQIRRSASSIVSNIAEGAARRGEKEFIQFLHIALGSASELETQLELTTRLDYFSTQNLENIVEMRDRVAQMLYGLIRKLRG